MIKVAKTAGFCFGVNRAVQEAYRYASDSGSYCTLGPIIHNAQVVDDLAACGIPAVDSLGEVGEGTAVIIRTHGVGEDVYAELERRGLRVIDLTCPYVARIHRIVKEHYQKGYHIVIIGDRTHPEVVGINGWCCQSATIIGCEEEVQTANFDKNPVCIVSQTTFHTGIYKNIIKILKKTCQNALIFDTICKATEERQKEAAALAQQVDCMVVLGGKHSSNTRKLYEVCRAHCANTVYMDSLDNFVPYTADKVVGITAGASTPPVLIKEAIRIMEDMERNNVETNAEVETAETATEAVNAQAEAPAAQSEVPAVETEAPVAEAPKGEQNFETLFEGSLKTLNTGDVVKGTVIEVRPNEVIVDLGVKQDGFIPAAEISDDPNVIPSDVVSVGDVIDVFVVRVNDAEGNIMLSKRKLDSVKTWNDVVKAFEDGTVLDGKVTNVVGGGVIAKHKDVKVFIPASQSSDRYLSDLNVLMGKDVSFKIIDINEKRRRVVGSIKAVLLAQKEELEKKFWETAEIGKKYTGVVKSITSFGAFVDLGGVDGLVHISELSWSRIKHPSEVVKEGETIEVYIKDIAEDTKKISLGFKKAEDNPWVIAQSKLHVDDVIKVKVVRMLPFGAFAEILPGVDGLIHISQIANKRINKPQDELEIGQEVEVKIVELDWENRKIGLSIRALLPAEEPAAPAPKAEEPEEEAVPQHTEELGATIGDALRAQMGDAAVPAEAAEEEKTE